MATFKVLRRVDAYADYVTEVVANSAEEAAALAARTEEGFAWEKAGVAEFDARMFVALDEGGDEIVGSECGDFT